MSTQDPQQGNTPDATSIQVNLQGTGLDQDAIERVQQALKAALDKELAAQPQGAGLSSVFAKGEVAFTSAPEL
ncbi:hypothetical protein [Dictyobacter formicarum]|uniref:Uncharacterized protein n=1 Tax=Dictyobacter formicarum TaxID=2778368 RepID=A0ABQ3VAU5_9CHLR|nr:hypothetical protein [Dictyobacter formicarum]GHO82601.1 hypothetical protein KSZ_06070 [Dictyobacter formicarum]